MGLKIFTMKISLIPSRLQRLVRRNETEDFFDNEKNIDLFLQSLERSHNSDIASRRTTEAFYISDY